MDYLHWDQITIDSHSPENKISEMYEKGYVFTRLGKGVMQQTRSVRIDLSKFELSSENRRILKKNEDIEVIPKDLPLPDYFFEIGKLGKDFYENKFEPGIMSAQKIKEMLTDKHKSNFNLILSYLKAELTAGYAICYLNNSLLHYSYPFYDLSLSNKDTGLGMMIHAIQYAKEKGLKYIYLGSLQRPSDTYKLQFAGLEWFDGGPEGSSNWTNDLNKVKKMLASTAPTL